ncbi:MAG: mycofactocin-coupled SDR family oxidoreductase [Trebonia sp.]
MAHSLRGKTAVITGGARGQGRSHALALAAEGVDIALFDVSANIGSVPYSLGTQADLEQTKRMVNDLDRRCVTAVVDVRDGQAMIRAVDHVVAELGSVDILCANAGILSWSSIEEMTDQTWQDMIDVNLTGVFNAFRAVAPHMRQQRGGRIVATASMAGRGGFGQLAHYTAAKWGLIGLTKTFALEMAQFNVTANVVAPTNVRSDMILNEAARKFFVPDVASPTDTDVAKVMAARTDMGIPWVEPSDVSGAILYLVSDAARYVTGEVIHVAAGTNAHNTA